MTTLIKRQSSSTLGGQTIRRPLERGYAFSVSGGSGGSGTRISTTTYGRRVGSGFGGGYDYQSSSFGSDSGTVAFTSEKTTMQHLNDRLSSYLETVRELEAANSKLEIQIREAIEKKGPLEGRDYSKYNDIIADLRAKILYMIKGNTELDVAVGNARLASDDFKTKMEYEMSMRQMVEGDVAQLRKILDDTNVVRMHLESQIESLKEELITLKKHHETDVAELHAQIGLGGLNVDVDAPKGQDLGRIMEEMRAKYERIAAKNQEDLKAWHESQITAVEVQVTESSVALKEAMSVVTETRRKCQEMEIELQSALSLKKSLEASLHDIEARNNMEMKRYNEIILSLQEELANIRTEIQSQTREYELLLNIKVKLEAEIAEYRRLLDGEADFSLADALDQKKPQTQVVTVTQTLVDGKVVLESREVSSSEA